MAICPEDFDAVPVRCHCVVLGGKPVHIPHPDGYRGHSFHHGRFQSLHKKAEVALGMRTVEATASAMAGRPLGVWATRKV